MQSEVAPGGEPGGEPGSGRPGAGGVVVTIGNFDGVHRGHVAVVRMARELAGSDPVVAVTFDPHPLQVLRPERAPAVLTPPAEKARLLRAAGADDVVVLRFDLALAAVDPADFVTGILLGQLRARAVVVGENFRFGYRAAGDLALLRRLGTEFGFAVLPAPSALLPDGSRVSSSVIRGDLAAGRVEAAAAALGRPHRLFGRVVHGEHRGRELGYPTANLDVTDGVLGAVAVPADGIYAVRLLRAADLAAVAAGELEAGPAGELEAGPAGELEAGPAGELKAGPRAGLVATLSVGTNPTFDGTERRIEANVLDTTELDLYGERVALDLFARQRPTVRFDSAGDLVRQMALDTALTRELLAPGPDARRW